MSAMNFPVIIKHHAVQNVVSSCFLNRSRSPGDLDHSLQKVPLCLVTGTGRSGGGGQEEVLNRFISSYELYLESMSVCTPSKTEAN